MINGIRIAPNGAYATKYAINSEDNLKTQDNNSFNEILNKKPSQDKNENNNVNFYSLGAPAGFFLDNSLMQ